MSKPTRQMRSASRLYAVQALFQMEQSAQTFDQIIVEFLDHRFGAEYEGEEMAEGDAALFRAAGAELTQGDTPPKVVINEFVEVARAFFPEGKEPRFVNGVLDHMAREAKPEAF